MSDYGLKVFLGNGLEILDTSRMGLSFPLNMNGSNISYDSSPNRYSQVEFPRSPTMSFWGNNINDVVNQFNVNIMQSGRVNKNLDGHLCSNMYTQGSITYTNGHITNCSQSCIGLTNNIGSPVGSLVPVTDVIGYGISSADSLITLAQLVPQYQLDSVETVWSTRMWKKKGHDYFNGPVMHLLVVPHSWDEIVAVCPADYNYAFSMGLYSQGNSAQVYCLFERNGYGSIPIKVYRYRINPYNKLYLEYGVTTFRADGSKSFSTNSPPLLPLYASNSDALNGADSRGYDVAVVYSRLDGLTFFKSDNAWPSFAVFNGVSWSGSKKLYSQLMCFSGGGYAGATTDSADYRFTMCAIDNELWNWIMATAGSSGSGATPSYTTYNSLPRLIKRGQVSTEAAVRSIGAFLAVVAH